MLFLDFVFIEEHIASGAKRERSITLDSRSSWDFAAYSLQSSTVRLTPLHKQWPAYAWPGGYPLYCVAPDGGVLSVKAANEDVERTLDPSEREFYVIAQEINWEDPALFCDHTNERIESAYAEDEVTT